MCRTVFVLVVVVVDGADVSGVAVVTVLVSEVDGAVVSVVGAGAGVGVGVTAVEGSVVTG